MRPRHRQMSVTSSCNTREADASQNMADGTLSPNSRELEDGEVVDVTELAPEGHGIAQDVEDVLDADHVPSSVVDEEEPPLEQARAGTPPSPLPQNKGKGRARTPSEDGVVARPRHTKQWVSRRDPSRDDDRPRRSWLMACPLRESRSRQSIAGSDQHSEYLSTSHHSLYDLSRQVMSTINLTHEMSEIKDQLARLAAIRADAQRREKEAKEEQVCSQLRLNNLEIAL
jgi:cell division protein ZapA (FtsZ GTPase activity inhibitor)